MPRILAFQEIIYKQQLTEGVEKGFRNWHIWPPLGSIATFQDGGANA